MPISTTQLPRGLARVKNTRYHTRTHLDTQSFYTGNFGDEKDKSVALTNKMVWLLGEAGYRYPMVSLMSELYNKGQKPTTVSRSDGRYHFPVMDRPWKPAVIAQIDPAALTSETARGKGHNEFFLYFNDNTLKRYYIIQSTYGTQVRIQEDAQHVGPNLWRYKVVLHAVPAGAACPIRDMQPGTRWTDLYPAVSFERHKGTSVTMASPGKVENQMGMMRMDFSWGAKHNFDRTLWFEYKDPKTGKMTQNWVDMFMMNFELKWNMAKEELFWRSRFNRDLTTRQVILKDNENGEAIPTGSGLLEQILNKGTYSGSLEYNQFTNIFSNTLHAMSDTADMVIELHTGRLGIRMFDKMAKAERLELLGTFGYVSDKFIEGTGRNLASTGFFNKLYHVDGYVIKVVHNPVFDYGKYAQISERDPATGLPKESGRMVFIDNSPVNGMSNIQFLTLDKQPGFMHSYVLGATDAPPSLKAAKAGSVSDGAAPMRSHDVSEGSYARWESCGVQLMRANRCFDLQYV